MNIKSTLTKISQELSANDIEHAGLEAELLICHVVKKPREFILAYPELALNTYQKRALKKLISRRINHEPLAYIIGKQAFYNIELFVNKHVLIPRPETEVLVEAVLKTKLNAGSTVIDLGTGSGAIIISLAKNLKNKHTFVATDISAKALAVAKMNAKLNEQDDKIIWKKSNLLKKFLKQKSWPFSQEVIITANLPYLASDWQTEITPRQIEELKREPATALFAGEDGFDLYRQLAEELKTLLKKFDLKIKLFCEISPEQANLFTHTFAELGQVTLERDLSGRIRVGVVK